MKTYKITSQFPPRGRYDHEDPASFEVHFEDYETEDFCLTFIFQVQGNNINGTKHREDMTTASVGDLISTTEKHGNIQLPKVWAVAPVGFIEIDGNVVHKWHKATPRDRQWIIRDIIDERKEANR